MKLSKVLLIGLLSTSLYACQTIPSGYVGVKVNLYGNDKGGVEIVPSGRYSTLDPSVDYFAFPVFNQNAVWQDAQAIVFQTKEGMTVSANVSINYSVSSKEDDVKKIWLNHRKGIEEITSGYVHNIVRDAFSHVASTMTVESVYGVQKNEFMQQVNDIVKKRLTAEGFVIGQISIVGTMKLPDQVIKALNSKIAATQQAEQRENELRSAEAAAKKLLIEAKAQAESNKLKSLQLNDKTVEIRKLEIQEAWIAKWNGVLPSVQNGSGSGMMLNITK